MSTDSSEHTIDDTDELNDSPSTDEDWRARMESLILTHCFRGEPRSACETVSDIRSRLSGGKHGHLAQQEKAIA